MKYRICNKCIMDTSDKDISFDEEGVCNHCHRYEEEIDKRTFKGIEAEIELKKIVTKIKNFGKGKDYDCIIGVSGGVDSTYVAYLTKKLGLRPLAIHFDNGWNSELAVSNIEKVLKKLNIDLYTYVIDWEEFRELQKSFLHASTPDGEIPTDHAINALLFQEAKRHRIKYIITGMNFQTESLSVKSWAYGHSDWKYIKSIHKIFSKTSLKNYPHFSLYNLFKWTYIDRIKSISILNYIDYKKDMVMDVLKNELDWKYYGGKHYESVYTRFYQGYILPEKFDIDKRRGHLSDLIHDGQITRKYALKEIETNPYLISHLFKRDFKFVMKKLELTENEFESIMNKNIKSFTDYPNMSKNIDNLKKFVNYLRSRGLYAK